MYCWVCQKRSSLEILHEMCCFLWTHQYTKHPIISWYSVTLHSLAKVFDAVTNWIHNQLQLHQMIKNHHIFLTYLPSITLWITSLSPREHKCLISVCYQCIPDYCFILFTPIPLCQRRGIPLRRFKCPDYSDFKLSDCYLRVSPLHRH